MQAFFVDKKLTSELGSDLTYSHSKTDQILLWLQVKQVNYKEEVKAV